MDYDLASRRQRQEGHTLHCLSNDSLGPEGCLQPKPLWWVFLEKHLQSLHSAIRGGIREYARRLASREEGASTEQMAGGGNRQDVEWVVASATRLESEWELELDAASEVEWEMASATRLEVASEVE